VVSTWAAGLLLSSKGVAPKRPYPYIPATFPIIADGPVLRPKGWAERERDLPFAQRLTFEERTMATAAPLMPKATAVWLLDNTALSFDQIAEFCKLHPLEVKAIADGDSAQGIKGLDPVQTGQLTRGQIEEAEKDHSKKLELTAPKVELGSPEQGKKGRYTPVSRRQDRPNAILWLVRNHPELKDAAIMRLVGTTKSTIQAIRERTHWNAASLAPMDPVTLGLTSQIELDFEVNRANKEKPVAAAAAGGTLLPASETTAKKEAEEAATAAENDNKPAGDMDVSAVFAKLKQLGKDNKDNE
jgi:hypothetical protein